MEKNKAEVAVHQKASSATRLSGTEEASSSESEEQPVIVADQQLKADYEKHLLQQKDLDKRQQQERRSNEEKRLRAKVMQSETKLGNLTEHTTHVFQSHRTTSPNMSGAKRERPVNPTGLAKKRQKLVALDLEDDAEDHFPRTNSKTMSKLGAQPITVKPKSRLQFQSPDKAKLSFVDSSSESN